MVERKFCDMCGLSAEGSGSVTIYDKEGSALDHLDLCKKHFKALQKFLKKVPEKP